MTEIIEYDRNQSSRGRNIQRKIPLSRVKNGGKGNQFTHETCVKCKYKSESGFFVHNTHGGEYHSIGLDYTNPLMLFLGCRHTIKPPKEGHVSASAKGACHDIALVALVWLTKVCITLYLAAMQCRDKALLPMTIIRIPGPGRVI